MKIKILHAEDDLMFSHIVRGLLEMKGFQVCSAYDGNSAWSLFQSQSPDICLLDIVMPGISGIDLGEKIREVNKSVPIFYLSSENPDLMLGEIYGRGGATGFFSKSQSINELSKCLNNFNNNKPHDSRKFNSDRRFGLLLRNKTFC